MFELVFKLFNLLLSGARLLLSDRLPLKWLLLLFELFKLLLFKLLLFKLLLFKLLLLLLRVCTFVR